MVTVTAAWWWQACREARGPCVAPRVTLLSACQYFCTWHTVLSYYHNCSIAMSAECQGSTSSTGQLNRRHFSFFISELPELQSVLLIYTFRGNGCRCRKRRRRRGLICDIPCFAVGCPWPLEWPVGLCLLPAAVLSHRPSFGWPDWVVLPPRCPVAATDRQCPLALDHPDRGKNCL